MYTTMKNHNPNYIDEVPIHRQDLGTSGVLLFHITTEREDRYRRQRKQSDRYVKGMKADQ